MRHEDGARARQSGRRVVAAFVAMVTMAGLLLAVDVAPVGAAPAQPGDLDPSFGDGGDGFTLQSVVPLPFTATDQLAVDGQGRVLANGTTGSGNGTDSVLQRFTANGQPDATFDGTPADLSGSGLFEFPRGIDVLASGEIVRTAEYVLPPGGTPNARLAIEKLTADGQHVASALLGNGGLGLAGATSGQLVALPDGKFLVGGSTPSVTLDFAKFFVVRFNPDLSVDTTFGAGGVAFADFGLRAVAQAIALQADGRILVSGHIRPGGDDAGVARFLPNGALDPSFSGDGLFFFDGSAGGNNDWGDSIAARPDGLIAVGGYSEGVQSYVAVLNPDGTLHAGFGTGGIRTLNANRRITDVAWDAQGRIVAADIGLGAADHGVSRFTVSGAALDPTFSGDGYADIPSCTGGEGGAVAAVNLNRIVTANSCSGTIVVARFVGEPGSWSGFGYTVTPASASAGRDHVALSDLDPQQLLSIATSLQATPLRASPLRASPLRASPLRASPLRASPLRASPLRASPLRASPLRASGIPLPLSSIPLVQDETGAGRTWTDVLVGTPYQDVPLQNVTFQQVHDLPVRSDGTHPLDGLTLAHIDLRTTPLRASTLTALLLSGLTLDELPAPAGGWCLFLDGSTAPCPSTNPASATLLDLEIRGVDLAAYYATPLPLGALSRLGYTPLGNLRLADFNFAGSPLGQVPVMALSSSLVTCPITCSGTLAELQASSTTSPFAPTATLAQLIDLLPAGPVADVTMGQVLAGLIRLEDLPVEELSLATLLDQAPIRATDVYTASIDYVLECVSPLRPTVQATLPAGARFVPGSATLVDETDATTVPVGNPSVLGNQLQFTVPDRCLGGGATHALHVRFGIEPPSRLGPLGSSHATLRTSLDVETAFPAAAVVADGHEPADGTEATATPVTSEQLYTGHLGQAGDVDLFHIPAPLAGSTVAITLSHLPADYDLAVYGADEGVVASPLRASPLRASPLRASPVGDALDEGGSAPSTAAPEGLADIPLRASPLRASSLNRSTAAESVTILSRPADQTTGFLIQVTGFDGAHSDEPYLLKTRVESGPAPADCRVRPVPSTLPAAGTWPSSIDSGTETLFLVDVQRLRWMYPTADVDAMVAKLGDLSSHPFVHGAVLPVESEPYGDVDVPGAYAAWDNAPCSVEKANAVVTEINKVVDKLRASLPELRHVVLLGSDEALPQARIPDLTRIANQVDYTENVRYGGLDNPISRAFLEGYVLSDEPYGDFDPQPWLSGRLYVSDVGLGRVVESPVDITVAADRFLSAGGRLDPTSGFVAGYDFLTDGATAVKTALAGPPSNPFPVSEPARPTDWTDDDAIAGMGTTGNRYVSVNAHYDHFEALPARPFTTGSSDLDQLLTSSELPADLLGSILFTMGCEAGLNVPDVFVGTSSPADELASVADWAQTATARGAVFAGNSGYGYGDTDAVALSERVMAYLAANLSSKTMTVGQALMFAKQRYNGELGVAGVYDAKALAEAGFFGLPMYRIGSGGAAPSVVPPAPTAAPAGFTASPYDPGPIATSLVPGPHGTHYEVPGEAPQVTHYRPIQPRLDEAFPVTAAGRIHGVVIESLTSSDVNDVDPAYATPTIDLGANEPEAATRASVFPASIQAVNAIATPDGPRDLVVLMPGQFFSAGDGTGRGTQRLYTQIGTTINRSLSDDLVGPSILTVDATELTATTAELRVTTASTDVGRAVALYRIGTDTTVEPTWLKAELIDRGSGAWSEVVPVTSGKKVVDLLIQLVDTSGNVGISSNKGPGYRSEALPATATPPALVVSPPIPPSGIVDVEPTITAAGTGPFEITVDGGLSQPLSTPYVVRGDGRHFVLVRDLGSGGVATLDFVVDLPVRIVIRTPADGAVYTYRAVPPADFSCSDTGAGVASCVPSGPVDTSVGDHEFTVVGTDGLGRQRSATAHYTVLALQFEGFFSPINNAPIVNRTKAGSAVPVKFRLLDVAGNPVSELTKVRSIESQQVDCATGATFDPVEVTVAAGSSSLKYDATANQYVFTWKSDKTWAGTCRRLIFTADGGAQKVALFNFTK